MTSWRPPLFFFDVTKGEDILGYRRLDIGDSYMHIIFVWIVYCLSLVTLAC